MSKDDRELIEGAAKYVLDNSRNGTWRNTASEGQCAADDVKLMEAYRDIIGKAMTFLAATRLEALQAQPVIPGDAIENVAREIAIGCNLDPDAISPKTNAAGHEIPEWMFFTAAAQRAIAALTASPPIVEREAIVDRGEIARIIDPHSFMDIPFTDDPVLLKMVEDSKGDALRKADAILALTPVEGVGES